MREPSVAGVFYEEDAIGLKKQVEHYLELADVDMVDGQVEALIVPHAGYMYSGEVAAAAYKQVLNSTYKNVFIIGTSHKMQFNGAAVYSGSAFSMPLGDVGVNSEIVQKLLGSSALFNDNWSIHDDEHSLEVQLPFLQTVLANTFSIVPILVGTSDPAECRLLAHELTPYFTADNLFVISTDFSHYPDAEMAKIEDQKTADAIRSNHPVRLLSLLKEHKSSTVKGFLTGLCGWSAVLTLMYITEDKIDFGYQNLLYQNSGDKGHKDKSRVVGYQAIAVVNYKYEFSLEKAEKEHLLAIAHQALAKQMGSEIEIESVALTEGMKARHGVFVSVYCKDQLRGCIGHLTSQQPLYELVPELVIDTAMYDARFNSITKEELGDTQIEISVLSPLHKITSIDEIELGKHGIFIKKELHSGTFLPQVGARNDWTVKEYLGHCAHDKAKLNWDGWKDAELFTYEAIVFSDRDD